MASRLFAIVVLVFMILMPCMAWSWPWGGSAQLELGMGEDATTRSINPTRIILPSTLSASARRGLEIVRQEVSDPCVSAAYRRLQIQCEKLDDASRTKLAIEWLNCQRRVAGWDAFPCSMTDTPESCLAPLDKQDFTQYNMFYLKVIDVCAALQNDAFRHDIEAAVSLMQDAVHDVALSSVSTAADLREMADAITAELENSLRAEAARDQALAMAHDAWMTRLASVEARVKSILEADKEAGEALRGQVDLTKDQLSSYHVELGSAVLQLADVLGSFSASVETMREQHEAYSQRMRQDMEHDALLISSLHAESATLLVRQLNVSQAITRHLDEAGQTLLEVTASASLLGSWTLSIHAASLVVLIYVSVLIVCIVALRGIAYRLLCIILLLSACAAELTSSNDSASHIRLTVGIALLSIFLTPLLIQFTRMCQRKTARSRQLPQDLSQDLLIDYIVRLRLQGKRAPMPPALVAVLTQPSLEMC